MPYYQKTKTHDAANSPPRTENKPALMKRGSKSSSIKQKNDFGSGENNPDDVDNSRGKSNIVADRAAKKENQPGMYPKTGKTVSY